MKKLWTCPKCGRAFANANQEHSCMTRPIDEHFEGRSPQVRELYDAFKSEVERCGPILVQSVKTRIAFQVRMNFAAVHTRKNYLRCHLVLARRTEDEIFDRVTTFGPGNHLYEFTLREKTQLKALRPYIQESYGVGCQEHLKRS
jgi:predicted transport protein